VTGSADMGGPSKAEAAALRQIAVMTDETRLRTTMANAERAGSQVVQDAALRRLAEILPQAEAGTVEHDFWKTIHAFEEILTRERKKTTRLSRTRQKIGRVGVLRTVSDLALAKEPSAGFAMLMARNMPELLAEAVVLRHPERFDEVVIAAARVRLVSEGIDLATLPRKS
jgi:hypothetical protein